MRQLLDLGRAHDDALRRIPHRRFTEAPEPAPSAGAVPLAPAADRDFTLGQPDAALFPPG